MLNELLALLPGSNSWEYNIFLFPFNSELHKVRDNCYLVGLVGPSKFSINMCWWMNAYLSRRLCSCYSKHLKKKKPTKKQCFKTNKQNKVKQCEYFTKPRKLSGSSQPSPCSPGSRFYNGKADQILNLVVHHRGATSPSLWIFFWSTNFLVGEENHLLSEAILYKTKQEN